IKPLQQSVSAFESRLRTRYGTGPRKSAEPRLDAPPATKDSPVAMTTRSALGCSAIALSALILSACGGSGQEKSDQKSGASRQTVTVAAVSQTQLNRQVSASGTVSAWEEVPVAAETGGLTAVALY
ncbi:hypothetical protein LTR94_034314, partial [Friedmanniomyces endolithicus]